MKNPNPGTPTPNQPLRWWPAVVIVVAAALVIVVLRSNDQVPFQRRNLQTLSVGMATGAALLLWWIALSRARWRLRSGVLVTLLAISGLLAATFRIRGVSGDLVPILEPRWVKPVRIPSVEVAQPTLPGDAAEPRQSRADYPQFLGPDRNAVITGITLDTNWPAFPPPVLWRQSVGAGWSGFAIVGTRAVTQEQRDEEELVTCREVLTGQLLWTHADPARYATTLAGVGPRATPTVVSNRVFTLGATGKLNCLDLLTGKRHWTRSITADAASEIPEWGFSGSPLVIEDRVIVSAGGPGGKSLLAYRVTDGAMVWSAGDAPAGYSSPQWTVLAERPQILAFNSGWISAHDPVAGTILWEHPWGAGFPHVAAPVVVSSNQVVFSSGYGVGAELLEIQADAAGALKAARKWQSKRMKAKFANLVARDGFLYGLDDGILACVDLRDGSQRWKEGRYGHGQGLWVGDRYLLMSEKGDLLLLHLSSAGPIEEQRLKVFGSKTWNPIALAGDLLLVRNDLEAAALRLPLKASSGSSRGDG